MLKQYRPLIYKNSKERNDFIRKTKSEQKDKFNYLYDVMADEGAALFKLVAQKIGFKLWKEKAWKNKTCRKKCPLGESCRKRLLIIDGQKYCIGQLLTVYDTFSPLVLEEKLKERNNVKIMEPNGEITSINEDEGSFFFEYEYFIWWFGERNFGKRKIYGENAIKFCCKE